MSRTAQVAAFVLAAVIMGQLASISSSLSRIADQMTEVSANTERTWRYVNKLEGSLER